VLPWQLAESYPNAWCTACVDHRGDPKPAFHAVARAFEPVRISARTTTSVWSGEAGPAAEIWLWSEHGEPAGSRVQARLRAADGTILGATEWHVEDEVVLPRAVGTLRVPLADVPPDAAVVWELTWFRDDATVLDHDVVLASTGTDFSPLLDLAPADLDVWIAGGTVEIRHHGGPMVLGLQLVDARPFDAPGWVVADGDPRPLLPGETRSLAVHTRNVAGPVEVRLESWNTTPVLLAVDQESFR
jgi:beta-mannosidase